MTLIGWNYCIIIVKDLAECWAQPYASKEIGPLTKGYQWLCLILASIAALFNKATGLPNWGMSYILGSITLWPYIPEQARESGARVDLRTRLGPGHHLQRHGANIFMGNVPHFSLPHSPQMIVDSMHMLAHILGVANAPFLAAYSDAKTQQEMSDAIEGADSALLEGVRDPDLRQLMKEFLLSRLGSIVGGIAFAALVSAASRRYITLQCLDKSARDNGFEGGMMELLDSAFNGSKENEERALSVPVQDARMEPGDGKTVRDVIKFIQERSKGQRSAKDSLTAISTRTRGAGAGMPVGMQGLPLVNEANIKRIIYGFATHLESSYAGTIGGESIPH